MKLSIIIPAYNASKYIKRCFESISSQDFNDLEILLVDDGSSDNTLEVCEQLIGEMKCLNIKILHKDNGGVSSARNFGIEHAKGEYLMFVDVDDYLLPDTLSKALAVVDKNPEADFCIYGFERISRNGTITHSKLNLHAYDKTDILKYINNVDALTLGTPCAKIFKRKFIDLNNFRFDTTRKLFEDICFNLYLLNKSSYFVTSDIEIYCYDVNNQSATAQFNGETFIQDATNYMNTIKYIIPRIALNNSDKSLTSKIIFSTEKTICWISLFEIYNLYRVHNNKSHNKYFWLNRLVKFMAEIKSDWQTNFSAGFPRIFVSAYKIHPRCADLLMRLVFVFKGKLI